MATQILIAPGYGNSGEGHWQTFWEKENSDFVRIQQRDWLRPDADEWADAIEQYVRETNGEVVVGNRDRLICTSTAAGPAFEGARISMGMRAATGAICAVEIRDGKRAIQVQIETDVRPDRTARKALKTFM